MRILHTGDWHVGRTMHRRQRLDEVRAVLAEIVSIAVREEVDLVLVCGDVFEHFAPSAEAERIVYDTFLALREATIPVVVLAGNHDYARRLEAVKALLQAVDVHVVAEARRADEGGLIEIRAGGDRSVAQIAVLPWVSERALFGAEEMMDLQGKPYDAYREGLPALLAKLCEPFAPEKVNVLAGHLFVSGARLGGGERELTVGQIFAIDAAKLPATPQYIALGHVHRAQEVPGAAVPARYSGSPLQLDFGEATQEKSVTLIDVEPGRPAQVREVTLTAGRRLVDVRLGLNELDDPPDTGDDAYLRVFLECEGPTPGLTERVREALPNAVEVRLVYERQDPERRAAELRRLDPGELFARYYRERHGAVPDERLTRRFGELLEEVTA